MLTLAQAARAGVAGGLAWRAARRMLLVRRFTEHPGEQREALELPDLQRVVRRVSRAAAVDAWRQTGPVGPVRTVNVTTSA